MRFVAGKLVGAHVLVAPGAGAPLASDLVLADVAPVWVRLAGPLSEGLPGAGARRRGLQVERRLRQHLGLQGLRSHLALGEHPPLGEVLHVLPQPVLRREQHPTLEPGQPGGTRVGRPHDVPALHQPAHLLLLEDLLVLPDRLVLGRFGREGADVGIEDGDLVGEIGIVKRAGQRGGDRHDADVAGERTHRRGRARGESWQGAAVEIGGGSVGLPLGIAGWGGPPRAAAALDDVGDLVPEHPLTVPRGEVHLPGRDPDLPARGVRLGTDRGGSQGRHPVRPDPHVGEVNPADAVHRRLADLRQAMSALASQP